MLNHRFEHGRPERSIERAGVLARLFDPSEKPGEPWLPCNDPNLWCYKYGDRLPASLISRQAPRLYSKGDSRNAGFILNSNLVELYCAYPGDGSTMNKMCDPPGASAHCVPGCPTGHGDADWCQSRQESLQKYGQCAWRPDQLDQLLQVQHDMISHAANFNGGSSGYNELVINPGSFASNLPHTIVAVFFPDYANARQQDEARIVHRRFLSLYDLTREELPLLRYSSTGFSMVDD